MVQSIGQKLSARTVDIKLVITEVRRVSDIICKPNTWQMQRAQSEVTSNLLSITELFNHYFPYYYRFFMETESVSEVSGLHYMEAIENKITISAY